MDNYRLSDKFYETLGGMCRRVHINRAGKMTEYPYQISKAEECKQKGKHPHRPFYMRRKSVVVEK
jgi:hypothetical protein